MCWEKLKTDNRQTHVHSIFFICTYMQPSSVGPMAALTVEPLSVEITVASEVTVTANLFLVPNSLLSFNLEGYSFMKILQAS